MNLNSSGSVSARAAKTAFGAVLMLGAIVASAQVSAPAGTQNIDNSGQYRHEVQSCNSGATPQDRATCLREARNAQADKQRGRLDTSMSDLASNATARCSVFTAADDKAACVARVVGGQTSGSVADGGVLRSAEVLIPPQMPAQNDVPPQGGAVIVAPVVIVPAR